MTHRFAVVVAAVCAVLPCVLGGAEGEVVLKCGFEGPYYKAGAEGKDTIPQGCVNNYEWGKKEIDLSIVKDPVVGSAQCLDIRSIASGELQFFMTGFSVWRTSYYRVSFKMKGEGVAGKVYAGVRKIGSPWTMYVEGLSLFPTPEWKSYTFCGKSSGDADKDLGVLFGTGSVGKLWLADVVVERFDKNPAEAAARFEPVKGNLLPRSSFEGSADYFWTSGIYAKTPNGEMEDPQIFATDGGKFGTRCLAFHTASTDGDVFCRSYKIPVAAGHAYKLSFWAKGATSGAKFHAAVQPYKKEGQIAGNGFEAGAEWKLCAVSGKIPDEGVDHVYLTFSGGARQGTILFDGMYFGLEDGAPAEYQPAFPCDLYVVASGRRSGIFSWSEPISLKLLCANAGGAERKEPVAAKVRIIAYPDRVVRDEEVSLLPGVEKTIELSPGENGIFRVELVAIDPAVAAPQEAIVARLPVPRATGEESLFGTHITVRPYFIDYAKSIGFKWVRLHDANILAKWCAVEPEKGTRNWYDTQVNALRQAGLWILGMPDAPPKWAKKEAAGADEDIVDTAAFEEHCAAVAAHYKGRIDHWEVWNEPYINYFFPGVPEQFRRVYLAGAKGLRKGNPEARIAGICSEVSDIDFVKKVGPDVWPLTDIYTFHCYFSNITGDGGGAFRKETAAINEHLGSVDGRKRELWDSEGALGGDYGGNSLYTFLGVDPRVNELAVAFGSRVWMETAKGGFSKVFIYTIHQSDTFIYYGELKMMIGFDRSVTPAAASTAVCAWCVDGLRPVDCPEVKGVIQSLFRGVDRQSWAVYLDQSARLAASLDLASLPHEWTVLDAMGNDPRLRGVKSINVGVSPLYVLVGPDVKDFDASCRNALKIEPPPAQ